MVQLTHNDLNEVDLEELGRLVQEGYTSGRLDDENKTIAWELKTNIWTCEE